MARVIGVRFTNAGKLYYFDPGTSWPMPGSYVVVETSRGIEFGEVVTPVQEITEETLVSRLTTVVRVATAEDVVHYEENRRGEKEAFAICQKKIAEHKLDMKLVSVEYTFDNSKILFYFTANGRVDFRSLVKDLASVFKTRIELRQIGVRDEAKMIGGLGPCGRPICCGTFLGDFQPVSIKMAKEQNLSLNPTKISGVCGRLMCCLKYEEDDYEQTRKKMPKVGKEVLTPDGPGVVWDLNVIRETVRVRIQKGDSSEVKDYPMDQVTRPGQQPAAPKESRPEDGQPEAPAAQPETDAPQPEKTETKQAMPKPVRRENPNRRGGRGPKPQSAGEEKPADSGAAKESPAPEKQEKPAEDKPAAPKQPAPSPWKLAVQAAMRNAQQPAEPAPKPEAVPDESAVIDRPAPANDDIIE